MADLDLIGCEHCDKEFPLEDAARTADGCYLCPECQAEWAAIFAACAHDWDPAPAHDEHGEEGRYCRSCHGFVVNEEPRR